MMIARKLAAWVGGVMLLCGSSAWAQTVTNPFPAAIPLSNNLIVELKPIASGLNSPVHLTTSGSGDGRLYVVDQNGSIRVIHNGVLQASPFLNVVGNLGTDTFSVGGERGLLGLAFHPDFNDSSASGFGKFYTYASVSRTATTDFDDGLANIAGGTNHQSIITEWSMSTTTPGTVDLTSRRTVMRIDQPQGNHNGGMLQFGPDGYMYITLGDGGNRDDEGNGHGVNGNGQNPQTILGSIVRIDPLNPSTHVTTDPVSANGQYRNPASNPFDGTTGLREIYATGLRNPYRLSFDEATNMLVIADVGQDKVEEVNAIDYTTGAGTNFGWRQREGSFGFNPNGGSNGYIVNQAPIPGLTDPVAEYDHDEGIAVIGGYVYRGSVIPSLDGLYVFGDYAESIGSPSGRLFVADLDTGFIQELRITLANLGLNLYLKGFGIDDDGEIYVLGSTQAAYTPGGTTGVVLRLVPEPASLLILGVGAAALIRRRRS